MRKYNGRGSLRSRARRLEFGAEILRRTGAGELRQFLFGRQRRAHKKLARGVKTAIQINGREHGLECVDEKTLLGAAAGGFLAAA